jgi:DNA-binding beta-propeller fold protein YncE
MMAGKRAFAAQAWSVELTGTHGKFDFIKVDAARRRLLACHTGNGTLDVIDLDSSKLVKSVPTGAAQGVAVDDKHGRYFVSSSKPPQLVIVDATKLEVIGTVPLPEASDLVGYQEATNRVLVDDDEKARMWIIDPESEKIVQTNIFPGSGMEDFCLDKWKTSILQNLKDTSTLAKSDFVEGKILEKWSTLPAEKPHGIALVDDTNHVLIAGGNGKLVLMDAETGKILASADIPPHVDQIAYDAETHSVYCASSLGQISENNVVGSDIARGMSMPSEPGAHSIAVDPKTHTVWTAFAKGDKAYLMAFPSDGP